MKEIIKKILQLIPNATKKFLYGDLKEEIKEIKSEINLSEKDNLRYKVLSFASSLRRGEYHTTQEYETIFHFHEKYENLIERLGEKNGFTYSEFLYIKEKYQELLKSLEKR